MSSFGPLSSFPVSALPFTASADEEVTCDKWFRHLSEPMRRKGIAAAVIASGLVMVPAPTPGNNNVNVDTWYVKLSEPVRVKQGLEAALQRFAEPDPFPRPAEFFAWIPPWSEPVRTEPRLVTGAQQVIALHSNPTVPFGWNEPFVDVIRPKPGIKVALQRFDFVDPFILTQAERVSEDKWHQPWSEPRRFKKGLGAHLQRYFEFEPFDRPAQDMEVYPEWPGPVRLKPGLHVSKQRYDSVDPFILTQAERVSEDKWHQPWSEPRRFKEGLHARLQQTIAFAPQPDVKDQPRWYQPWSEPVRVKLGLDVSAQRFLEFDPFPRPEQFTVSSWFVPFSEPVRFKRGLRPSLQQYLAFVKAAPFGENVSEDKWHQPWSEPRRFRRGLDRELQQAGIITPRPDIADQPRWFQPWSMPSVLAKEGLLASLQQFFTIDPRLLTQAERVSEDKFHVAWSEPVRFRHTHPARAPFFFSWVPFQATAITVTMGAIETGDIFAGTAGVEDEFVQADVAITEIVVPRAANTATSYVASAFANVGIVEISS